MDIDLTLVWAGLLGFAVFAYIVMDGFDLGVGILFPTLTAGEQRDKAMNSIAPVWDGNETWLILGGGGLFAAFPLAYAIIMPAIYTPIIAMLLGLVFRGVAFEYRWRTVRAKPVWDVAFFGGSLIAAFFQGVALGAILQGIEVSGRAYGGGWWDWLSPFSVMTGVAVVVGYALLGATWLNMKTEHALQAHARRMAWILGPATLVAIGAVSAATPFLDGEYARRWFEFPGVILTTQVPILVTIVAAAFFWTMKKGKEVWPFLLSLALFGLTFAGLGVSVFPYAVPDEVTLWQAAAPHSSQLFMLVGALVLIPIILAYTAYAYWVFRGKVADDGYH